MQWANLIVAPSYDIEKSKKIAAPLSIPKDDLEVRRITGQRVLIIMDNSPGHFEAFEVGNIWIVFFHPNVMSLKQPCGQGIIAALKKQAQTRREQRKRLWRAQWWHVWQNSSRFLNINEQEINEFLNSDNENSLEYIEPIMEDVNDSVNSEAIENANIESSDNFTEASQSSTDEQGWGLW